MRITYEDQGLIFNIEVKPENYIAQYRGAATSKEQSYTIEIISYPSEVDFDKASLDGNVLVHEFQGFILLDPIEEDVQELFLDDWIHKILFQWELKNSTASTPPWAKRP
jgi:hypothetical protein